MSVKKIYDILFKEYGPQGWWPLINHEGCNPTKTGCVNGYHPGDYSFPRNDFERFEIIIGAVLTQNTAWPNVEKALINLDKMGLINPKKIICCDGDIFKEAIRPAGYFNQKAGYIRNVSEFYLGLVGSIPSRQELLSVKGIGEETADSILLYAYKQPEFVIDAYARRIFSYLGLIDVKDSYGKVKKYFEDNLTEDIIVLQEYHALLVEHGKRFYSKKLYGCELLNSFRLLK